MHYEFFDFELLNTKPLAPKYDVDIVDDEPIGIGSSICVTNQ
jgi:hypothetical protein